MEKLQLEQLKKKIAELSAEEKLQRDLYLRALANGDLQGPPVGYASIDKPWLGKYPEQLMIRPQKAKTIVEQIKSIWPNQEECIIDYYDTKITVENFFNKVFSVAKSLKEMGINDGDCIFSSLESTPEFLELLLASEIIGCSLKSYIGDINDIVDIINRDNGQKETIYFTHDYISKKDAETVYSKTSIKNIITVNPLFSVDRTQDIREHIIKEIDSRYDNELSKNSRNISFDDFLSKGSKIKSLENAVSENNVLFCAFTSGTTGIPKEVMHTSGTILGIINQMALIPHFNEKRESWMLTVLPPTLVAVVVAMTLYPLIDGKELILNPFCNPKDIDLEMMHYEPECWGLIPMFFSILLESERIPNDYDMSYFKLFGFGAEPITKKFASKIISFLQSHNCQAPLSSGYGQSEGGSDMTMAIGNEMILSGTAGMPLIDTNIGIFKPGTDEELNYYQVGEICKSGPGIMVGYSDSSLDKDVLITHSDGTLWLHTKDTGFMTEQGLLFVLGRSGIRVYPDKYPFPLTIENKIDTIDGVKESIIVSSDDKKHVGYELPYLFIVPEKNVDLDDLSLRVNEFIDSNLFQEEKPVDVDYIEQKPISKFKTDRKLLKSYIKKES